MNCNILIIGGGRMGQRYKLVCDYLHVPNQVWDITYGTEMPRYKITHVIISVPTDQHWPVFNALNMRASIMVEKPLAMSLEECDMFELFNGYTVNNWCHVFEDTILRPGQHDISYWSQHFGPHSSESELGKRFDLCQLYYLSRESPKCSLSAVWRATVDGREVSLHDIDLSYVRMIKAWLAGDTDKLWTFKQGSEMTKILTR